jgi:hypothetical protein
MQKGDDSEALGIFRFKLEKIFVNYMKKNGSVWAEFV